jgi:hypothetical protein
VNSTAGPAAPGRAPGDWTALGVLRRATSTWLSRWGLFATLAAVSQVPLIAALATAHLEPDGAWALAVAGGGFALFAHALAFLAAGLVSAAVVEAEAGRRPSLWRTLRIGGRRSLPLLATGFNVLLFGLLGVTAAAGLVLGLSLGTGLTLSGEHGGAVAHAYLALGLCGYLLAVAPVWVALPVAGAEPVAPPEALRRSRELLRGRWPAAALLSSIPLLLTVGATILVTNLLIAHGPIVLLTWVVLELLVLAPFTAVLAAVTYTTALRAEASASTPLPAAGTAPYPP